jgi:hypothetical protein
LDRFCELRSEFHVTINDTPPPKHTAVSTGTAIPWKLFFRLFRWSTYAAAIITLILVLHKSPAPNIQISPQAAARVEEKFQQVEQSVANGQPAAMRMDETELNSYLASHLELAGNPRGPTPAAVATPSPDAAGTPPPPVSNGVDSATAVLNSSAPTVEDVDQMRSNVKDVKVQLVGDHVIAYVVFDVHGKDMTLQLEGKLGSDNGYIRFEPVSGQIGALPLPLSALQSAMQRLMESPENREKLRLPTGVSGLKIENGEVVTTYQ